MIPLNSLNPALAWTRPCKDVCEVWFLGWKNKLVPPTWTAQRILYSGARATMCYHFKQVLLKMGNKNGERQTEGKTLEILRSEIICVVCQTWELTNLSHNMYENIQIFINEIFRVLSGLSSILHWNLLEYLSQSRMWISVGRSCPVSYPQVYDRLREVGFAA